MSTVTIMTLIWAAILAAGIIIYVILDGFDLGIGILFPLMREDTHRDILMNSIAPVWDGNETWLVFGGALLYGIFPLACGHLLPSLYIPILFMLAALIFRGISFEFRFKAHRSRFLWDWAFFGGSTLAAFFQGVILGTFIQGFSFEPGELLVPNVPWLTPFSMMTGLAVVMGYALLGSTWSIIKTTGELQSIFFDYAKQLLLAVILFMVLVSLWTPFVDPEVTQRWFSMPNMLYLAPLPIATAITAWFAWRALQRRQEKLPFILTIVLFLLAYTGFGISAWPYIVPREITFWEAAAPLNTQIFVLVGTAFLLPILIGYTIYAYSVFKGKVNLDNGYH